MSHLPLNVTPTDDKIIIHCHGGCDSGEVLGAMCLTFRDLYFNPLDPNYKPKPRPDPSSNGKVLFRKLMDLHRPTHFIEFKRQLRTVGQLILGGTANFPCEKPVETILRYVMGPDYLTGLPVYDTSATPGVGPYVPRGIPLEEGDIIGRKIDFATYPSSLSDDLAFPLKLIVQAMVELFRQGTPRRWFSPIAIAREIDAHGWRGYAEANRIVLWCRLAVGTARRTM